MDVISRTLADDVALGLLAAGRARLSVCLPVQPTSSTYTAWPRLGRYSDLFQSIRTRLGDIRLYDMLHRRPCGVLAKKRCALAVCHGRVVIALLSRGGPC